MSQFHSKEELKVELMSLEREKILGIDPSFVAIVKAEYFDNYDLPCPVRVTIKTEDGGLVDVVLRQNRHGEVEKEIQVFRALEEYGLPVPKVLVGAFLNESGEHEAVYALIEGENLQKLSMRSEADLRRAKELLVEAVIKLMEATPFIEQHEVSKLMPRITLMSEFEQLHENDNPWLNDKIYQSAIEYLRGVLKRVNTTLVISNGDYQPGNFLAKDGKIVGYLDFESASFQDPMMGFIKYPIYDMLPLSRTSIVEEFLKRKGFSKDDFRIRLILGCMKILKDEIPITGGDKETEEYRTRILELLRESLGAINQQ